MSAVRQTIIEPGLLTIKWSSAMKIILVAFLAWSALSSPKNIFASTDQDLSIKAGFEAGQPVTPSEQIEVWLSRPLRESESRVAILIGTTDVSALFAMDKLRLRYNSKIWPLPLGQSELTAYLVSSKDEWKEVARFILLVNKEEQSQLGSQRVAAQDGLETRFLKANYANSLRRFVPTSDAELLVKAAKSYDQEPDQTSSGSTSKKGKMSFLPSLTFGLKAQPAQSTFPASDTPERATFADLTTQASLKGEASYGVFSSQSSGDFAGSSFRPEALRFGELGSEAPKLDLASYLLQFQTGPVKYQVGHFSFGTQRHLINSFSSRGITITVPFLKRFDLSGAAMNGTQLVGYDNFFGLNKRRHQMLSSALGIEVFPKQPGGLRLEVGVLSAYFQPISGINRGVITDLQRSRGVSLRLIANDKSGRFHFEGGFTRSFFDSPGDTTLDQGQSVVPLPALSRNAHYLEASYEVLRGFSVTKNQKANLKVSFREENVAPLFRSLGASTQADKIQYEFSVAGSINEVSGQFSYVNFHDNLRDIPSILKSINGTTSVALAAPAKALFGISKDTPWLPRLGYNFNRVHSFGAAIPVNGGFEIDLSSIPNLFGTNHTFSADWQIKKFTIGYNVNRSLQDNQQTGRELSDQAVLVNSGRFGVAVNSKMNLNVDLSAESSANRETGRIDRTFRLGPGITWQLTQQMGLTANLSNTIAGDAAKTSRNRNTEFDASWTYRFGAGKEGLKKVAGQFFIRYANRFAHAFDRIFVTDSLRKNQTLTANLSFTFF
ncbi:MAG: hypothetical protein ABR568_06180 [Pyrinomonadaceae bacterium]